MIKTPFSLTLTFYRQLKKIIFMLFSPHTWMNVWNDVCRRSSTAPIICFFRVFAKLPKAIINFVMSICLSVRMEHFGSHSTDFHDILYLRIFRNYIDKIQVPLKLKITTGTCFT